jgi:endonuclease/exonuclease/phosphatase family metal-dependent hydrolase
MSPGLLDEYDPGYGPLVDTTLRIATWNVWATYGPWQQRQPAIHAVLQAAAPDVVALQEAYESLDGTRSQAREIATTLGHEHVVFAPNLVMGEFRAGNAIVSRWPIARHAVHTLPRTVEGVADDEGEERLCVFADIAGPRGPVQVFCTHLSWRGDHSAIRAAQVAAIAAAVRATRPRSFPAIVCGDLNSTPDSDEIRALTGKTAVPVRGVWFHDLWEQAGDGPGHTAHRSNPWFAKNLDVDRRIDYILAGNPKLGGVGHVRSIRLMGTEAVDGVIGSDHYGLVADLRY